MSAVRLEIPEETLISLKTDAESFGQDLKMLGPSSSLSSGSCRPAGQPNSRHDASGIPPCPTPFQGPSFSDDRGGAAAGRPQCLTGWSSATLLLCCISTRWVGHLELLPRLYGQVQIPSAVQEELSAGAELGIAVPDVSSLEWLQVQPLIRPCYL
jgi:hypothetical protein